MTPQQELFAGAAEAIAEIGLVLETLNSNCPKNRVIQRCIEVQAQLVWYLNDAKAKLGRNEFTEKNAAALAVIIERGMNNMIHIIDESNENLPGTMT